MEGNNANLAELTQSLKKKAKKSVSNFQHLSHILMSILVPMCQHSHQAWKSWLVCVQDKLKVTSLIAGRCNILSSCLLYLPGLKRACGGEGGVDQFLAVPAKFDAGKRKKKKKELVE